MKKPVLENSFNGYNGCSVIKRSDDRDAHIYCSEIIRLDDENFFWLEPADFVIRIGGISVTSEEKLFRLLDATTEYASDIGAHGLFFAGEAIDWFRQRLIAYGFLEDAMNDWSTYLRMNIGG